MSADAMTELRDHLRSFTHEREWDRYHTPKNLAMVLIVEVAELVEHFQWLTPEQSHALPLEKFAKMREEVADVLI